MRNAMTISAPSRHAPAAFLRSSISAFVDSALARGPRAVRSMIGEASYATLKAAIAPKPRGIMPVTPYASHTPVLVAIARLLPIRSILECGSGQYSTKLFLDRALFPHLRRLTSFEDDARWAERVRAEVGHDPRVKIIDTGGPVADAVSRLDVRGYDLIFIDDSCSVSARAQTIRAVATQQPPLACVVIHDFEVLQYRVAASPWKHRRRFDAFRPNTGLLWNDAPLDRAILDHFRGVVEDRANETNVQDGQMWADAAGSLSR